MNEIEREFRQPVRGIMGQGFTPHQLAHRARCSIDFGFLNQDCLWVLDEPQPMGTR